MLRQTVAALSAHEERALIEQALSGDIKARDRIVLAHIPLVGGIVRKHYRYARASQDYDDLCHIGIEALYKAIEKFDVSHPARFSTFASFTVREYISAFLNEDKVISVPQKITEQHRLMRRIQHDFHKKHGARPTHKDLVQKSGFSDTVVRRRMCELQTVVRSLDAAASVDAEATFGMFIPDIHTLRPDDALMLKQEYMLCLEYIASLKATLVRTCSARNVDIFLRRYAIDIYTAEEGQTLDTISHAHPMSQERIRQIVNLCWKRVSRANKLFCERELERTKQALVILAEVA